MTTIKQKPFITQQKFHQPSRSGCIGDPDLIPNNQNSLEEAALISYQELTSKTYNEMKQQIAFMQ